MGLDLLAPDYPLGHAAFTAHRHPERHRSFVRHCAASPVIAPAKDN